MKVYDSTHEFLLKKWIISFNDLINWEFKEIKTCIFFTWWTSLLFKYKNDFYRFSTDLDFSVNISCKTYDRKFYSLLTKLKETIELTAKENDIMTFETDSWRELKFVWENWIWSIKLDWMYDYTTSSEIIEIDWYKINKASDLDILSNKTLRLNKTDIQDIKYLMKRWNYKTQQIKDVLLEKWKNINWNPYYYFDRSKPLWTKNIKDLPFLKDLLHD